MIKGPIIVASPSTRCGTTLLQRLITSSENGICYGENAGKRLVELSEFSHRNIFEFQSNQQRHDHEWANISQKEFDYWMVGLELPGDFTQNALLGAVQFFKQNYDEATRSIDKEIWGIKVPELKFLNAVKVADLFPDTKLIYVYRNIYDVIKSQKSKKWLKNTEDLAKSCEKWVSNTKLIATLNKKEQTPPEMLLPIKFEDLSSDVHSYLQQIEKFTGIIGIKPEIADVKINTWVPVSKRDLTAGKSYQAPAELSEIEMQIIRTICDERMSEIYPELCS
jgi:sulfotransferase family protein